MSIPLPLSSVHTLEATTLASWPALETQTDGAWVSRFSRGHTKRANSLTILDAADDGEVDRRLDAVVADYRRRGLPPTHRLSPLTPPAVAARLTTRGGAPFERSLAFGRLLQPGSPVDSGAQLLRPTDPAWIGAQTRFHRFDAPTIVTLTEMLARISVPAAALLLEDERGEPSAAAMVLLIGPLAMILKVVVAPDARGRGFGKDVMGAALGWAAGQGATEVFLHALASNAPAVSLYRSLGFVERYSFSHVVFG